MWAKSELVKLAEMKREFEAAELISKAFPRRVDFQKIRDALELTIHTKEMDRRD